MGTISSKPLCQKEACSIQSCLKANNHRMTACQQEIMELIECCKRTNAWDTSPPCSGFPQYRPKVKIQTDE